jgi:ABC-type transport system involved in cytochrome c biogenesis permease subunit
MFVLFLLAATSILFLLNVFRMRDLFSKIRLIQKMIVTLLLINIIAYIYLSFNAWGKYWDFDPNEIFRLILFIVVLPTTIKFTASSQKGVLCKVLFSLQAAATILLAMVPYFRTSCRLIY